MPLQEAVFDLGCHGYTHTSPSNLTIDQYELEIKEAFEFLRATFEGQRVLTYAAPNNSVNDTFIKSLDDYAISCRIGANGTQANLDTAFDMYRIKGFSFSENTDFDILRGNISNVVQNGGWAVHYFHTVSDGEPFEGVCTSKSTLDAYCKSLYDAYNGQVWFGSFQDVSIYAMQKRNVRIENGTFTSTSMEFNIDCDLDEEIYNIPMTLKLYVPFSSTNPRAEVNGENQSLQTNVDVDGTYVLIRNISIYNTRVVLYV